MQQMWGLWHDVQLCMHSILRRENQDQRAQRDHTTKQSNRKRHDELQTRYEETIKSRDKTAIKTAAPYHAETTGQRRSLY